VRGDAQQKVQQTIAFMVKHVDRRLQVSDLAALANVSCSHYFALFKQTTGYAPIDFFIRLRISHACAVLDSTTLSVKEVAAKLGYDDQFYFSRVFKSVSRVAPSEYRSLPQKAREAIRSAVSSFQAVVYQADNHQMESGSRFAIFGEKVSAAPVARNTGYRLMAANSSC